MRKLSILATLALLFAISCKTSEEKMPPIQERIQAYAPTAITADISHLNSNQLKVIKKLAEAGRLADEIFWRQTSFDAREIRDSLKRAGTPEADLYLEYVMINYGPYDVIHHNKRFVGEGPERRPPGGSFYPLDMTKEEFNNWIEAHPEDKEAFESQYTVITRMGDRLEAYPYRQTYPQTIRIAKLLDEAADLADNESLKKYLKLRAEAIRTDDYFESDMAWMDLKENDIDVIIGPIENYEDELFNYKTAYECVIMVKDREATEELEFYEKLMDDFEHNLPCDSKYIRESAGKANVIQVVNVLYFGGDCQKGAKTIACSLPNDPRVHKLKGGKKTMYKNMMEAKFEKIVVPIAERILDPSISSFADKKAFTSFVTLHEISHTLGRGYVFGNDDLTVRKALKERYSAIEETKADILALYNHKFLLEKGNIDEEYMKKAIATYIAGLYRSLRFGAEEAHGKANLIQLNYLRESGALLYQGGKFNYNKDIFFDKVAELAKLILETEAEGDYAKAGEILEKYGVVTDEISKVVASLSDIPRDIDTEYAY